MTDQRSLRRWKVQSSSEGSTGKTLKKSRPLLEQTFEPAKRSFARETPETASTLLLTDKSPWTHSRFGTRKGHVVIGVIGKAEPWLLVNALGRPHSFLSSASCQKPTKAVSSMVPKSGP